RGAIKRLHAVSGGIPRVINLLCDRALMIGAERGVHDITASIVDEAADAISFRRPASEVDQPRVTRRPSRLLAFTGAAMAGLAVLALVAPLHRLIETPVPSLPDAPDVPLAEVVPPGIPPEWATIEAAASARAAAPPPVRRIPRPPIPPEPSVTPAPGENPP